MRMKIYIVAILCMMCAAAIGQGTIDLRQLRWAADSTYVIGANGIGRPQWVMKSSIGVDSFYIDNVWYYSGDTLPPQYLLTYDNNTITLSGGGGTISFNALTGISIVDTGGSFFIENILPENTTVMDGMTIDLTETADEITAEVKDSSLGPEKFDRTYLEEESQVLIGGDGELSISSGNTVVVTLENCELEEDELYLNLQFNVDQIEGFVEEAWVAINDTSTEYALKVTGDAILLPRGDNDDRPAVTSIGILRFNTSTDQYEVWTGNQWETLRFVISANQIDGSYTESSPVTIGDTTAGSFTLNVIGTAIRLPVGRSFERPTMTVPGLVRYNYGFKSVEYFNGTYWKKINTEFNDTYYGYAIDEEMVCVCQDGQGALYALDIHAKGAIHLNTSDRPANPVQGIITYNMSSNKLEGYNGIHWIEF